MPQIYIRIYEQSKRKSKKEFKKYFIKDLRSIYLVYTFDSSNEAIMKTYELSFQKVSNPASYSLIEKLRNFEGFVCGDSNSQLMKRLDFEQAEEILSDLKNGINVELK
jgi:hypothetical protein